MTIELLSMVNKKQLRMTLCQGPSRTWLRKRRTRSKSLMMRLQEPPTHHGRCSTLTMSKMITTSTLMWMSISSSECPMKRTSRAVMSNSTLSCPKIFLEAQLQLHQVVVEEPSLLLLPPQHLLLQSQTLRQILRLTLRLTLSQPPHQALLLPVQITMTTIMTRIMMMRTMMMNTMMSMTVFPCNRCSSSSLSLSRQSTISSLRIPNTGAVIQEKTICLPMAKPILCTLK